MTPPPTPDLSRMADEDLLSLVEAREADAFEVDYSLTYRLLGHGTAAEFVRACVMKTPLPDGERKPSTTVVASLAATGGNGDLASAGVRRFAAAER